MRELLQHSYQAQSRLIECCPSLLMEWNACSVAGMSIHHSDLPHLQHKHFIVLHESRPLVYLSE